MRVSAIFAVWLFHLAGTWAYGFFGGHLSLNKQKVADLTPSSSDVHRLSLDTNNGTISLAIDIGASAAPHQLAFVYTNKKGLDHTVYASFKHGQALLDQQIKKIPDVLKLEDRIFVSIVVADSNPNEKNFVQDVLELVPSEELKSSLKYEAPARLGPLPEIHHQFGGEQATVFAVIPILFIGVAGYLVLLLLKTWNDMYTEGSFAARDGSNWKVGYLVVLGFLELTFVSYYLGSSIFLTIFKVALVAGPFLFFGSRALTTLAKQRAREEL